MSRHQAMSLFGMSDDPFGMMRHGGILGQMDNMMGGHMMSNPFREDPFFGTSPLGAMFGGPRSMGMMPFQSPFTGMMPAMNDMSGADNMHSFSSSSVMTMTTGPDGRPQVYQASSSSRSVPGGVKETRRTESNSQTGVRKMAIGHHINERGHIIEKEMVNGADTEERQEYLNIDEDDLRSFDAEFNRKTRAPCAAIDYRGHPRGPSPSDYSRSTYRQALPSTSRRRPNPLLAISSGSSGHEDRVGQRERKQRKFRNK